jgi:methyl-accepting chemotaxis protein
MTGIELPSVASTTSPKISYSKKRKSLSLEWFYNLPVKGKQLTGLFTSEVISIVGVVGVGAVLIVAAPNQVVTGRAVVGTQSYTIAAKALSDVNGNPVAVLVRGTEETALNKLLGDSLLLQLAVSALTLVVDVGLALLLGRTIAQPLKQLQQTTQRFARGDRQVRAKALTNDLQHLQVKAHIMAPLFLGNDLLGLLCVQQCSEPRNWQPQEIALFKQAQAQTHLALQQAHLIEQLKRARQEAELGRQKAIEFAQVEQARQVAELASFEQRQQKEELQRQVLTLLQDIEGSADGDYTVRANVTEGTIGTVADFFNAIIENLRQIVRQVKQTAIQVNTALQADEQSVEQLSLAALKQADEIRHSLEFILAMTSSIQAVAENARQAAAITRVASTAAQTGGKAIDSTVNNIVNLRERVVETTNKAKVLDESSQEIAKVVNLVQEISLKTRNCK